jgi:AraC-like DNA-binding protein
VSHILLYRESFSPGAEVMERVLPDGALRLIFNLGDAPVVSGAADPAAQVIGASAVPAIVRMRGRMHGISVTLRPGAGVDLLGTPAGEFEGSAVALDALWRGDCTALLERMAAQRSDAARVALLGNALQRRLAGNGAKSATHAATATHAAQLIAVGNGQRPLREIAATVGIGERRLQQLFHQHVGMSPRTASRLARMHACLRALRHQTRPAWADLAAGNGFYDQSHLVNEFRAICGMTPSEFLGRTVSGSSKTRG